MGADLETGTRTSTTKKFVGTQAAKLLEPARSCFNAPLVGKLSGGRPAGGTSSQPRGFGASN